jgi:hypothetical protein
LEEISVNELGTVTNQEEFGKILSNLVQEGAGVANTF